MQEYQRMLVALDALSDYSTVLDRALAIASDTAELSLIYVVEPIYHADVYAGSAYLEIQDDARRRAVAVFNTLGEEHDIPTERQIVEAGRPATAVHHHADELKADLIVIGSHGRHGVQLLLGSTANAVLHGAKCDVLAVRVGEKANSR